MTLSIWDAAERLTIADLYVGQKLVVDDCFRCMEPFSVHTVENDAFPGHGPDEWFIRCARGKHMLDRQDDWRGGTGYLVGVRRVREDA